LERALPANEDIHLFAGRARSYQDGGRGIAPPGRLP
jgi:hypothetical protein